MTQPTQAPPPGLHPPRLRAFATRVGWIEATLEGVELGLFMTSACVFTVLFEHPKSLGTILSSPWVRRSCEGLCMGLTAAALVYSPMGKRSGAHMNPAVTLTFYRLGRVHGDVATAYVVAQFLGAFAGVALSAIAIGAALGAPEVNYVVTLPGHNGVAMALACEALISGLLMFCVLWFSNHPRFHARTGWVAALLILAFIVFEAPYSGMSMNPARTLGSALFAQRFDALWVYFVAPPLGMLTAAEVYLRLPAARPIVCAKCNHTKAVRCPFHCAFEQMTSTPSITFDDRTHASKELIS